MAVKSKKVMSLIDNDNDPKDFNILKEKFHNILNNKIHGLSFSPYLKGQKLGDRITEKQIRERLEIIKPHTNWIRIFSCTEGHEQIPKIAHEYGIKTLVGAWIGESKEVNEEEISNLIELSKQGYVDIAAVGNEVILREEIEENELIDYIKKVKKEIKDIPVGYVDAYYEFCNRPALTEACDIILANCYPFWEGCRTEYSLLYMKDMYRRIEKVANGKKIIISETGWPNKGTNFWTAVPSNDNALKYFINAYTWAQEENIDIFYFSAFDEDWKIVDEGDVGAYWGIWDNDGKLKYQ